MAVRSFELDQLLILIIPLLIHQFCHGFSHFSTLSKRQVIGRAGSVSSGASFERCTLLVNTSESESYINQSQKEE
jgi:hypothetical protein